MTKTVKNSKPRAKKGGTSTDTRRLSPIPEERSSRSSRTIQGTRKRKIETIQGSPRSPSGSPKPKRQRTLLTMTPGSPRSPRSPSGSPKPKRRRMTI